MDYGEKIAELQRQIEAAEERLDDLHDQRAELFCEAKENGVTVSAIARAANMRRETAHYTILRQQARKGVKV